jgi:hypothetical protein
MKKSDIEVEVNTILSNSDNIYFTWEGRNLRIDASAMYERPNLKFSDLDKISALLCTKEINVEDGHSRRGCDSCDHGSSYSVVLEVNNIGLQIED